MKRWLALLLLAALAWLVPSDMHAQKVDEYRYFSNRMARIIDQLHLTSDQEAKVKPIIEQEVGLLEGVHGNPVLSRKEKLKKYWAIVRKANSSIKPILTTEQLTAFDSMQADQKEKYDKWMEEAKKAG